MPLAGFSACLTDDDRGGAACGLRSDAVDIALPSKTGRASALSRDTGATDCGPTNSGMPQATELINTTEPIIAMVSALDFSALFR
jgi:hypothetical protein